MNIEKNLANIEIETKNKEDKKNTFQTIPENSAEESHNNSTGVKKQNDLNFREMNSSLVKKEKGENEVKNGDLQKSIDDRNEKNSKNLNDKLTENINNKMEAGANSENKSQGLKNNDIKVDDFFVNEQNAHNQEGIKNENINAENNSADLVILNSEKEKIKIEDINQLSSEIKYSKIPEFDEENRKTRNSRKNLANFITSNSVVKVQTKKIILDEEDTKKSEENKDIIDNIELYLDESHKNGNNKVEKKPKKEKEVKKKTEFFPELYEFVTDIDEIKKKEKIENSDIILCLIEICTNSTKYGLSNSNKSRLFWDELFRKNEISAVFKNFKSETLRKYWRLINELDKNDKVIETVKKYEEQINKENVKLLTIINAICDSIKGKHKSLESYFNTISTTHAKRPSTNGKKNLIKKKRKRVDDESSDTIENDLILINKNIEKSKKETIEGEEEEIQEKSEQYEEDDDDDLESDDEPFKLNNVEEFNDRKNSKKRLTRHQIGEINKMIKITDKEKKIFSDIDQITDAFIANFPNLTKNQILDVLNNNSFNLENSYLQLVNPENFESKGFTQADDYIIQNLKETDYYQELLDVKGEDLVKIRHIYLNIEDE